MYGCKPKLSFAISFPLQGTACCAYGTDGKATDEGGYDCLMIPGAINAASALKPASQCGHGKGLVTAKSGNSATICSKSCLFHDKMLLLMKYFFSPKLPI